MMTLNEVAAPLAAQQSNAGFMPLLFFGLVIVAFYFFLIRPQRNRQRQQQQLQNSVRVGARVMTTNGMFANVVAVDDDGLVLEIAPGVEARFVKQAIMRVVEDDADEEDEADLDDETDDETDDEVADTVEDDESVRASDAAETADEDKTEKSSSKPSA